MVYTEYTRIVLQELSTAVATATEYTGIVLQELSTAVATATEYTGIVFTSKRAVESVVNLHIDIQVS